jgi:hypothetical protein
MDVPRCSITFEVKELAVRRLAVTREGGGDGGRWGCEVQGLKNIPSEARAPYSGRLCPKSKPPRCRMNQDEDPTLQLIEQLDSLYRGLREPEDPPGPLFITRQQMA